MLETVTGTWRCEQDSRKLRMPIEDESVIRRHGVKTSGTLDDSRTERKTPPHAFIKHSLRLFGCDVGMEVVGIAAHFVLLGRYLEPPEYPVDGRKAVKHISVP